MKNALLSAAAVALVATGCGGAPSTEEVRDAASFATETLYVEGAGASDSIGTVSSVNSLQGGFDAIASSNVVPYLQQELAPLARVPGLSKLTGVTRAGLTAEDEARAQGQAAAKFLRERIFTNENVEQRTGDALIFRITGEDVCGTDVTPAAPECVEAFDKFEVRIKARKQDGIELTLLLGPDRFEPVGLMLSREHIGVRVDLAGVKGSINYLHEAGGSTGVAPQLPRVFEGVVELILRKHGEQDYSVTTNVVTAVRVEVDDAAGTNLLSFSTAARAPLAFLRANAIEKRVTFDLDVGETNVSVPYETSASPNPFPGARTNVHLSGASYAFSAKEGDETALIAQIGIGEARSSIKLDAHELVTFDLNPGSARHFDVSISRDADGLPLLKLLPELDLTVGLHLAPLKADPTKVVEAWEMDEVYNLRLSGANGPVIKPIPSNVDTGFPGGLKIVSGELVFSTSSGAVVTVDSGLCLVRTSTTAPTDGGHPLLGQYATQSCP